MIDQLLLHHKTKSQLKSMVNSTSHAYLFYGPKYSGKMLTALSVTAELAKNQVTTNDIELILRGEHHHLLIIRPIEGKSIKINQIKDLTKDLSLKSYDDSLVRVIIIEDAQKLTLEAGNSLLKNLEEPPENTIFFLLTTSVTQVLPTIASRCQALAFLPIGENEIRNQIELRLPDTPSLVDKIIELSEGKPALALHFINEPESLDKFIAATVLAKGFDEESLTTRFKIAQEVVAQEKVGIFLEALITKKRQELLADGRDPKNIERLMNAEKFIERNVNSRLVLEHLALEMGHL